MKAQLKLALMLGLGAGILGAGAAAQGQEVNAVQQRQVRPAVYNPARAATLQQVDDHRRCDGDGDRDDRGCYYVVPAPYGPTYYSNGYYGNGYYVTPAPAPYYAPNAGWYDRDGHWHAYDRDRDRDRYRHDDDDRR